jgi:hypothetical protein
LKKIGGLFFCGSKIQRKEEKVRNTVIKQNNSSAENDVLKATSLIYFEDALLSEQYEDCPELIQIAKDFGASAAEIRYVIARYVRSLKDGRPNEASINGNIRRV